MAGPSPCASSAWRCRLPGGLERRPAGRSLEVVTVVAGEALVSGDGWRERLGPRETLVVPAAAPPTRSRARAAWSASAASRSGSSSPPPPSPPLRPVSSTPAPTRTARYQVPAARGDPAHRGTMPGHAPPGQVSGRLRAATASSRVPAGRSSRSPASRSIVTPRLAPTARRRCSPARTRSSPCAWHGHRTAGPSPRHGLPSSACSRSSAAIASIGGVRLSARP